jgi:phage host-nuclease inhibitor protein Gam
LPNILNKKEQKNNPIPSKASAARATVAVARAGPFVNHAANFLNPLKKNSMSKTREKKVLITKPISDEDAENYFAEYAAADARVQQITAKMDVEITRIREKYADDLTRLNEQKQSAFEKLQHYALNAPEKFVKRKSLEMTHGIIGFRTGTPSLKALKGQTWASVLQLVKSFLPEYVRVKEEVDKEALLNERDNPEVANKFTQIGVRVEQSETFYVEPKKELAAVN